MSKKISVIMPTYNDCDTIEETLDTLINQSFSNWELIIIDDGSTDDTKKVIQNYKKKNDKKDRIKYIYQENKDQLLAIINGMKYITGDYVYLLHSDDLLYDDDILQKSIDYMIENQEYDGIFGDLVIIDKDSKITGKQKVLTYKKRKSIPPIQLLWLGRNLYIDFALWTKKAFESSFYYNYLIWDRPYWLSTEDKIEMLNMKKVDFSIFKYRVYDGNYANNELGKLCLIMGEIRTAIQLMAHYHIPFYKIQYTLYRIFVHLNLFSIYRPLYFNHETNNKSDVLKFIVNKRYPGGYEDNTFLSNLVKFYDNNNDREIDFDKIYKNETIFQGNGFRIFNRMVLDNKLPAFYKKFLEEMGRGFTSIAVSEKNYDKALDTTKFLCIYPFVKIRRK